MTQLLFTAVSVPKTSEHNKHQQPQTINKHSKHTTRKDRAREASSINCALTTTEPTQTSKNTNNVNVPFVLRTTTSTSGHALAHSGHKQHTTRRSSTKNAKKTQIMYDENNATKSSAKNKETSERNEE